MIILWKLCPGQLHDLTHRLFRILIFHKEKVRIFSVGYVRQLPLVNAVCVHNDPARLCLSEYFGETNYGKNTRIDHIPQHIPGTHAGELVNVAHHHKAHGGRNRLKQRVHQKHVYHGALVHNQDIPLQGILLILLISFRRLTFQQPVNRPGFQACRFRHPLCRAARGRCQKNFQPVRFICGDNPMGGGRLTGSRSSRHHHDLCGCGLADRICLYFVVDHPGFFLYGFHIHGKSRIP